MTAAAVMQPTYLPWAGYFNLIAHASEFIFLDDVQFAHRSWQQRNRILLRGEAHWLTVPVKTRGRREQWIVATEIDESTPWRKNHFDTVAHAYARAPHGREAVDLLADCLARATGSLADLNEFFIRRIAAALDFRPAFSLASQYSVNGARSAHLAGLCRACGAETYLSAAGSREYIEAEGGFVGTGVKVAYQSFHAAPYPQGAPAFVPCLSIIDVVAQLGLSGAAEYVCAGWSPP